MNFLLLRMLLIASLGFTARSETPLATLVEDSSLIVTGHFKAGAVVTDEHLNRQLVAKQPAVWRKIALCRFEFVIDQVIKGVVPGGPSSHVMYFYGDEGSCALPDAGRPRVPGENYLWLLRMEHGILRPVIDSYQVIIPLLSRPEPWESIGPDKDWRWCLTYLLMAPGIYLANDDSYADKISGSMIDVAGWMKWLDVLAEIEFRYPKNVQARLCRYLISFGVCCNCEESSAVGGIPDPCQSKKKEAQLMSSMKVKSLEELKTKMGDAEHNGARDELALLACNVSPAVSARARELLKQYFEVPYVRCPACK